MYESPDQEVPVYDAKGIETVRRDGCPAVAKVHPKHILKLNLAISLEGSNKFKVKYFYVKYLTTILVYNIIGVNNIRAVF